MLLALLVAQAVSSSSEALEAVAQMTSAHWFSSHPISKFNTPKIEISCDELYPEIPSIWPLSPLPHHDSIRRLLCGKICQPEPLLQIDFLGTDEEAAIIVHDSSETIFEKCRPSPSIPFNRYGYTRVHSRSAPLASRPDIPR